MGWVVTDEERRAIAERLAQQFADDALFIFAHHHDVALGLQYAKSVWADLIEDEIG